MKRSTYLFILLVLACFSTSNVNAATRTWNGSADTNYNNTANWSGTDVPDSNDSGVLAGGGTGITDLTGGITPSNASALNVRAGHIFNINNDGGSLTVVNNLNVGRGATGNGTEINHSAGAFNIGGIDMGGNATGGTSSYNLSGTGALAVTTASRSFNIGGPVGVGDFDSTFSIVGDTATVTLNAVPALLQSSAIIDLTLGATGIDTIDTTGNMSIASGAALIVDGSSYTGGAATIPLFTYATRTDATEFAETITGFGSLIADIVYDTDSVDLVLSVNTGAVEITSFTGSPLTIHSGDPVTLDWSVVNETSLILDPGSTDVFGTSSIVVNPTTTTTYTLTAGDGATTVMDTVEVVVIPEIVSFTADDSQVGTGDSVNLSWVVEDATVLTLDPGAIDVTGLTTYEVFPTTPTTYTLTAGDGTTDVDATVDVQVGPVINSFTTDLNYVVSGGAVTINWTADHFTTLTLDPGAVDVSAQSTIVVNPTADTTYTLTAADGVNADDTATFDVVIIPDYPVIPTGGRVISVNFHVGNDASSATPAQADHELTTGETAGFIPQDGAFWNNINVGPGAANDEGEIFASTTLIDDQGTASVATLAPSTALSTWFVGYAATAAAEAGELGLTGNDDDLFNSYLALNGPNGDGNPADAAVLSISGLGSDYTSGGYTLIIYSDSDRRSTSSNTRRSEFTLTPAGGSPIAAIIEDDDPALGINVFDNTYIFSDEVEDSADYANFTIITGLTTASFDLELSSLDGGRGAISGFQIIGNTGLPADPLVLNVVTNGANLDFDWNSLAGMSYHLRGNATLGTDPSTWSIVSGQGDILATPPTNTLSITRPVDDKFFYIIEEFPTPVE